MVDALDLKTLATVLTPTVWEDDRNTYEMRSWCGV